MSIIATAVKHLIAAGVSGDDLVRAIADMEAQHSETASTKTARQERNARYYAKKASEKRLNSDDQDNSDVSDGVDGLSSPEVSPHTPLPKPLQSIPPSPPKGGSSPAEFGQIWAIYPHKVGKPVAEKAFSKALKRASFEAIMAGLRRYVAKTDDRPWCNLSTWLNQDRWDDAPALPLPRQQSQAPPRESEHDRHQRECREAVQRKLNGDHGHDKYGGSGPAFDLEPGDYRAH